MDFPKPEHINVIFQLLPGFLSAWIFYGLTAHPRKSPFERIVEALIFTSIVQALVPLLRVSFYFVGQHYSFGIWTNEVAFGWSLIIATFVGLIFSMAVHHDWFHSALRKDGYFSFIGGITQKTSFPSEWFSAFSRHSKFVVLHLKNGRRLYGWPYEWPDAPDKGHFLIEKPEWLSDDNKRVPLESVLRILVSASDVEMVEFLKSEFETFSASEQAADTEDRVCVLQTKENNDARET